MIEAGVFVWGLVFILSDVCVTWWRTCRAARRARPRHVGERRDTSVGLPAVSVLIPARHEPDRIGPCLDALRQIPYPSWEIVVIASRDDATYEAARDRAASPQGPSITVIEQSPGGKNVALNQGLAVAHGEVIAIIDADTIVGPNWLSAMVRPLLCGASASSADYFPLRCTWVSRMEQMEKFAHYSIDGDATLFGGACAIRRDALDAIGGFPTDVFVACDWDLGVRLAAGGMFIAFAKDACVLTERPATLRESWVQEVRWRRGHLLTLWRHRAWFCRDFKRTLRDVRFYFLAVIVAGGAMAAVVSSILGWHGGFFYSTRVEGLLVLWLAGRRTVLAGRIASFTGDWRWIRSVWTPVVRLGLELSASWWALLTLRAATPYFKGPRPAV